MVNCGAVGGHPTLGRALCERLDTVTGAWVSTIGGFDHTHRSVNSCECLDKASNQWVPAPAVTFGGANCETTVFQDQLYTLGG